MKTIDLNSDLGESFGPWKMGDDAAMLTIVTSASIACGFHAGDPAGILRTLKAAAASGVTVGAHIGYRDLAGFGRRNMDPSAEELTGDVIYQISALRGLAGAAGTCVRFVKPHGALYNTIAHDTRQAANVIEGILSVDRALALVALAGSPLIEQARKAGLHVVAEAFADRGYMPDGSLVPRREKGAVLDNPDEVATRMVQLAASGMITAVDGSPVAVETQSICLHGDTPGAVAMAREVRRRLEAEGVHLCSFASEGAKA